MLNGVWVLPAEAHSLERQAHPRDPHDEKRAQENTAGSSYLYRRPQHTLVRLKISQLSECIYAQSYPILCNPMHGSPPGPLSTGFSRQEYWSGLLFPPPGDITAPGIEPGSLMAPALVLYH